MNDLRLEALRLAKDFHYKYQAIDDDVICTAEKFIEFLEKK